MQINILNNDEIAYGKFKDQIFKNISCSEKR